MDYIEEQNQIYEQEYEQEMQERKEVIREYVMKLSYDSNSKRKRNRILKK